MSTVPDRLEGLPPLRDVIAAHELRAHKALGQNFLLDQNITDKIVTLANVPDQAHIFEIGPGPGGLTRSLLRGSPHHVTAIEFDARAVAALQDLKAASAGRLEIIHGDALDIDLMALSPAPRAIIANLPYNVATPLLIGWLAQIRRDQQAFSSMTLMFQKEVAQRIAAKPGSKAYGRLSVLAQWLCEVRSLYDLPPSAFTPPPKVKSSVVRFVPKQLPQNAPPFESVEALTAAAFGQRRKMIRSSLKEYAHLFPALNLDETVRAENLSVADYTALAQAATKS